ncbi:thioredoxin-disulfide reductase [Sphingomonas kaistensis]|uniref:Thioredoxin reductase n=1 Tax=Sphingomonas kaistensis TaxID=298708 RepID=A0ABZ2G269_9SPHN
MSETIHSRLIVLGSGPAGLTAAIYAARAGLQPIVIQGIQPGGQLTTTTDVENYPGFRDVVQGPWLMEEMQAQAEHVGTRMVWDHIDKVELNGRPFRLHGDGGTTYLAETLVIATGAQAKWLGLPSEERMKGKGASACATCDGFFYRGKKVAVIGGGNTAVEEALYLTNHSDDVTLIHRRDSFRAEKILQDRLFAHKSVKVIWNSEVDEFLSGGEPEALTGLRLKNRVTGELSEIAVDGAFVAIGHKPATELFDGQLDLDEDGYLAVETGSTRTNIPGVFACGDVMDKTYRQAVTAAGTGCMAALDAERFLAAEEFAELQAAE